ncbi:xylan 1,4-beta-xylosidase [Paenibacillus sp. Soil766]
MAFTGVFFGMYATGNDKQSNVPAAFDCFEYKTAD